MKKDKTKAETEQKNLQSLLEKKKAAESELEAMIKDLKEKLGKFDGDKKSAMKMEKAKRDTVVTKLETEKKEIQEKLEKMKLQFEKAAIESKTQMARHVGSLLNLAVF